ncbi:MAG: Formyltetrahydrofolate deformylase [Thermoanaerobaculia bacterium]|nr:Formyltetrahydrofolate deformylase [Thermoanaerobaculia bacterium]
MTQHLLLIDCPDEKGLVHRITGVLFHAGFNITSNQEFVDSSSAHFFMRTAFEGESSPEPTIEYLRQILPSSASIRLAVAGRRPIVLMVTKEPHCLGDLLLRHEYGDLPGEIRAVVGNHDTLRPLAERFGIPFHHVPHEGIDRAGHESRIQSVLASYAPEYVVLAKYMRILSPEFIREWPSRLLNIHHSFLPAFAGANPYRQAFDRGVKIIGATAHFVTEELDEGPIISQGVLPVDHTFTAADMAQAGRDVEKLVLAKALRLVLSERVFLHRNRTITFD